MPVSSDTTIFGIDHAKNDRSKKIGYKFCIPRSKIYIFDKEFKKSFQQWFFRGPKFAIFLDASSVIISELARR